MKNIVIFEDEKYKNLLPLVHLQPVFELKCGALTLYQKIERFYQNSNLHLYVRDYLKDVVIEKMKPVSCNDFSKIDGEVLFINGRILLTSIIESDENEMGIMGNTLIYLKLSKIDENIDFFNSTEIIDKLKSKIKVKEIKTTMIEYLWDLIKYNSEQIIKDYEILNKNEILGFVDKNVTIYGEDKFLTIGENSRIEAGVILNVTNGPILISKDVLIKSPTIIEGPCSIGNKSVIDGAKIRTGVSIGAVCKIAGELEEDIVQDYSNKHHDGFLGHSYLGSWVNLGAMTTNSDLKNNYGEIKIYVDGQLINSGEIKLGCFIGDHTKTGIGTLINTGTVIGIGSNVFGGAIVTPKFIPSFAWGNTNEFVIHEIDKCITNAKKIMARRKIELTNAQSSLLQKVFELTEKEREKIVK